ncbi:hypothetical protein A8135_03045 [Legionella jamestowniensis]|uniref:F-box domain-containing protein n=1 Tax=Legionella jamestowniensis TaxID=455 RepID=A0ABX2XT85_9GAMM|nr:hypothetical protein [Legionella jamestowniensis]OCH97466.1 hypothetical protein A8135_03045 [Legionella jamestowniensis]
MKTHHDIEHTLHEDKFEFFDELPLEIQHETAKNLSSQDLLNLSLISRGHWAFFKHEIAVRKLLHHVVHGEYEAVQSILRNDIHLIFKRSKVTDCSGRVFEMVSAFEYALWALDKHMWDAMLDCLPQNEETYTILELLNKQYNKVNEEGVTYNLNGKNTTEKHFDFENTIIKELRRQVNLASLYRWGLNLGTIERQWIEDVGSAQKLFPMHVVYEYCSNEPFCPVPNFTLRPPSSTQFYNWIPDKKENWFGSTSKLGLDFSVLKGVLTEGRAAIVPFITPNLVMQDLAAMMALHEIRTMDFIHLKLQLETQLIANNPKFLKSLD